MDNTLQSGKASLSIDKLLLTPTRSHRIISNQQTIMSSPGSDEERNDQGNGQIWHPAREWLEQDEDDEEDLDYTVPSTMMESEDDWEEEEVDMGQLDTSGLGLNVSEGSTAMTGYVYSRENCG